MLVSPLCSLLISDILIRKTSIRSISTSSRRAHGRRFFQDVYVDGVRVMLIIGPTGTGKSVHGNQPDLALEQKYGGFTYIFDIGGSYESVVELYGGQALTGLVKTAHG